jgi:hypothetical protein
VQQNLGGIIKQPIEDGQFRGEAQEAAVMNNQIRNIEQGHGHDERGGGGPGDRGTKREGQDQHVYQEQLVQAGHFRAGLRQDHQRGETLKQG